MDVGEQWPGGPIWTYYRFQKVYVAKGTLKAAEFDVRLAGGVIGGVDADNARIPMPMFVPGEEAILFLGDPDFSGYMTLSVFAVFRVRNDPENGGAFVSPPATGLDFRRAADGSDLDRVPDRIKLEDFLHTIEQRY